jgi:hypothetical protein
MGVEIEHFKSFAEQVTNFLSKPFYTDKMESFSKNMCRKSSKILATIKILFTATSIGEKPT